MEIKELGKVAFVDKITSPFLNEGTSDMHCFRDDCAVVDNGNKFQLLTTEIYCEGIHFDLTYNPLKHLGYKCIVAAASDILAMNGIATSVLIAIAIPARFSVEHIEEFYQGVEIACMQCSVKLIGGDTTASVNGLSISITVFGEVEKEKIVYRNGARNSDLICITGDLGAAYLGVKLLAREKDILKGNDVSMPKFEGFEYQLNKALKPSYRKDIIEQFEKNSILPTSMIDISDGLASSVLHICRESNCSAKLFLDKLPIAASSFVLAEELKTDAIIAAMNGGEDYELMFTVPVEKYEEIVKMGSIDVIGHICPNEHPAVLVTPDGGEIAIKAQGWSATD